MSNWNWSVTVGNPPRGDATQADGSLAVQSMAGTFAWGSNPGTATVVYVGNAPVTTGALVTIRFGLHHFVGICKSDVTDLGVGGNLRTLEFVDVREFLKWDFVYCAFNKADVRIINGVRTKRYRHMLPGNFDDWAWTYTNTPLTASEIVGYLLGAGTIGTPWGFSNNGNGEFGFNLLAAPVYEFDALDGKRLDAALNEVAAATGTVFGLTSSAVAPYLLVFTRKGYGAAITLPAHRDGVKSGNALSGNPTRIRILGGRNVYQAANLDMEKDWAAGWEAFLDESQFVEDIFQRASDPTSGQRFNALTGDTTFAVGYAGAAAYAQVITVGQYVALRNGGSAGSGTVFVDNRKFSGKSRMDMPAVLYIKTLVFRAFRPTAASLTAANMTGYDIVPRQLCSVSHNFTTGLMTHNVNEPVDGGGYVIAKGFQVGDFSQLKSDQIDVAAFTAGKAVWGVQSFQVDDSGDGQGFIIMDTPVFVSNNLLATVNSNSVLNASAVLETPLVKACLCFEAEKFSWVQAGAFNNGLDGLENVSGLNAEYVGSGGAYVEVPFADGSLANNKASVIAAGLLNRQYVYSEGGHRNIWDGVSDAASFGTPLRSMIDRVQFQISATGGVVETVDYTNERQRNNFEPERALERRTIENTLVPGQAELRQRSELFKANAAILRQNPAFAKYLADELRGIGNEQPLGTVWTLPRGSGLIAVGTPMRKSPTETTVKHPADATGTHTVFAGLTVHENVSPAGRFNVATTGVQLARVKGPVSVNDSVGLSSTPTDTFLVKDGTPTVGKVLKAVGDGQTLLVRVMLGAGGGGGFSQVARYRIKSFQGDYMTCRTWNGVDEGTADVLVAKPTMLRNSLTSSLVDGVVVNYAYQISTLRRGAGAVGIVAQEVHAIVPRYNVNDVIYVADTPAIEMPTAIWPVTVSVAKIDVNVDGRFWARI